MGAPRLRSEASAARLEIPFEEWSYLDQEVLVLTRSRQVCMTCQFFRHHTGPYCIPQLACHLHQGLIAHGDHLTHRCSGWAEDLHRKRGWAPEVE